MDLLICSTISSNLFAMDKEDPAAGSRWPELPSDLVRDVSGRLQDPVDFIRFHAVCKPWCDTAPPSTSSFLPMLVAPDGSWRSPAGPLFRSVFSSTTAWQAYSVSSSSHKWLKRADGGGTWLLLSSTGRVTADAPCLVSPLTGAVTARLPRFPDQIARTSQSVSDGVVFADGTIFLRMAGEFIKNDVPFIVAAVLRPGDAAWTTVVEPLATSDRFRFRPDTTSQINGEIVLSDFLDLRAVRLRLGGDGRKTDVIQTRCALHDPVREPGRAAYTYTVESRGELLSVHFRVDGCGGDHLLHFLGEGPWRTGQAGSLSVSVYALELGAGGGTPRWVWRDCRSLLRDRVPFLGSPESFAVDAARFGAGAVDGGCAYLVIKSRRHAWTTLPDACLAVYKYSFLDGSATVVAELPDAWETAMSIMWFVPHVALATTQEIKERLEAPKTISAPRSIVLHAEKLLPPRQFGPYFKILVSNLPWNVDDSRLRQFFNGHGRVADATVVYDRVTGRSRGVGFITLAAIGDPAVAVAALNGQVLDGRTLRVSFAGEWLRREPYVPLLLPQQQPYRRRWW